MNVYFYYLIFLFFTYSAFPLTIGSNTNVSRQATPIFSGSPNSMIGFGAIEQGFILSDTNASCSYDNFFPISGNISLNGGKLYLQQDLKLSNTLPFLSPGTILGNNHAVILPDQTTSFSFIYPYRPSTKIIPGTGTAGNGSKFDWNYSYTSIWIEEEFVSVVKNYSFNGLSLTLSNSVYRIQTSSVRRNPRGEWIGISSSPASPRFRTYKSNGTPGGSLTLAGAIDTFAWHPTGNFLTLSRNDAAVTYLYSFNRTTGALAALAGTVASQATGEPTSASWSNLGNNYVSIGKPNGTIDTYSFNPASPGSGLTLWLNTVVAGGADPINSVDWCPTGSYLAVGLNGTSQNLRIYKQTFGPSALTHLTSANVGITTAVRTLHWHPSGLYLATASVNDALLVYKFDPTAETLTLIKSYPANGNTTYDLRWSSDGQYLAVGVRISTNDVIHFYNISDISTYPMNFFDTTLVCNSNLTVASDLSFGGTCKIIGTKNNKVITMGADKKLFVRPGSNLTFENIQLSGVKTGNLVCMNDSASIIFHNANIQLGSDYTFSNGAITFDGNCIITGTSKFSYSAARASTIASQSLLVVDRSVTFSYDPATNSKYLLNFANPSSKMLFRDCTLVATRTGMSLNTGNIFIDGTVTFSSQGRRPSEGIVIHDSACTRLFGASNLNCFGFVNYNPNEFLITMVTNTAMNRPLNMVEWQRSYTNVYIAMRGELRALHFTGSGFTNVGKVSSAANVQSVHAYRRAPTEPAAYDNTGVTSPVNGTILWFATTDLIITSNNLITVVTANSFRSSFLIPVIPTNALYYKDNTPTPNLFVNTNNPPTNVQVAAAPEKSNPHAFTVAQAGEYYAVGTQKILSGEGKFQVRNYGGIGTLSLNPGFTVQALDWNPTGSFIAAGLHGSTDNLRIYKHVVSPAAVTQETPLTTNVVKNINTVAWSWDGNYLAAGTNDGTTSRILIYGFDKTNVLLTPMNDFGTFTSTNVASIRWGSNISNPYYLTVGLQDGNVTVYSLILPESC